MEHLVVFTDLDGTLLDHHTYSYAPAVPVLERLEANGHPLILNSSKTRDEMVELRAELGNRHPFVVENGGAVCVPREYFAPGYVQNLQAVAEECDVHFFGSPHAELLQIIHRLRGERGYRFRGFSDMSTVEVAAATGLSEPQAALARDRVCSEPISWEDTADALSRFEEDLDSAGLRLLKGGRFYHVMGRVDKAMGVAWLMQRYRRLWPGASVRSVALGDGPNDRAMLEAADLAVVIPAAEGKTLRLERSAGVVYAPEPGPRGWRAAMEQILP